MRLKITLLFFSLTLALLLAGGLAARHVVATERTHHATEVLRQSAGTMATSLAANLQARQRDLAALAAAIGASPAKLGSDPGPLTSWLAAYQPAGFAWLALVDSDGRVIASTGQALEGDNLSSAIWFQRGQTGVYTSDQHALAWPAPALEKGVPWGVLVALPLTPAQTDAPPATPLAADTPKSAVLVGMLGEAWLQSAHDSLLPLRPTWGHVKPDLLLRTRVGTPWLPNASGMASPVEAGQCGWRLGASEEARQCTVANLGDDGVPGLGWQVTLALPASAMAAHQAAFDRQLALAAVLAALAMAGACWWLAGLATGPMRAMTRVTDRMAQGDRQLTLTEGPHSDSPLGLSLGRLLASLRQNEADWVRTQLALETRVEDRTRALEKAVAELQEANTDLDRFASMVSHDLLAPVRAMRTFSELLLMDYADQLPEEARRLLTRVDQAGQDMSNLVNALHALSKLGHKPLQVVPTDVQAVATQTVQAHTPEWNTATVTVQALPPCPCDPGMIRVVFDNLIGNAVKYSQKQPQPQIVVGGQEEDERCVYWVADNGAGFDPAYAHRLFQIFQRLHSQREYPGTGVGLATVARIVHRHGGKVWAEGAPNEGATFYFSLPKVASEPLLPVTSASA